MKKLVVIFISLFSLAHGQESVGAKILILSPYQVVFEKAIERQMKQDVQAYRDGLNLEEAEKYFQTDEFKKSPENNQMMSRYEVNFLKTLSHENLSSYLAQQMMVNQLYRKMKGLVVLVKNTTASADTVELEEIARAEEMDFVLNFSEVNYFSKKGENFCSVMVQLYDNASKRLLVNQLYTGNASNVGMEKICAEGSSHCSINNALGAAFSEVLPMILENNPAKK